MCVYILSFRSHAGVIQHETYPALPYTPQHFTPPHPTLIHPTPTYSVSPEVWRSKHEDLVHVRGLCLREFVKPPSSWPPARVKW